MRRFHTFIVLLLVAAPCAGSAQLASVTIADPMAPFARLIGGEWKRTFPGGTSMYESWHWGPGKHSISALTDGTDAEGKPWRSLRVAYWHPVRQQICMIGQDPFARGVFEGTIKFERDTADAVLDLYQTGAHRHMGLRWIFAGPDKYRETLLEATDASGLKPLVEWEHVRSEMLTPMRRSAAAEMPEFPERLRPIEPLVGHTWESTGDSRRIRSTCEWIPYANGIYTRTVSMSDDGNSTHQFDTYLYHHTGTGELRCLALSDWGGVFEGNIDVLEGGALRFDLRGYEGNQVSARVVQLDFEGDGTLRQRVWTRDGDDQTLVLDVRYEQLK